ncbi:MAG: hypothetical protein PHW64_07620 [Sulfuricurvum sp.]|nr:hypothetical protein [Sulfuricurvum sp.]
MMNRWLKIIGVAVLTSMLFTGCGGGGGGSSSGTPVVDTNTTDTNTTPPITSTTAPIFGSAGGIVEINASDINVSIPVYDATANNDENVTYSLVAGASTFNITAKDGNVTFKTVPNMSGSFFKDYNVTIRATNDLNTTLTTDLNVSLHVVRDVISLGSYGNLILPIQVGGKWFYYLDRDKNGLAGNSSVANNDDVNASFVYTTFVQDINGTTGTVTVNGFKTTNTYRYATLNGIKVALPTSGTGNASESDTSYNLTNNTVSYTDLAKIWDTYNTQTTSLMSFGWMNNAYWSATPSATAHALVWIGAGTAVDIYDNPIANADGVVDGSTYIVSPHTGNVDGSNGYIALEVVTP